MPSSGVDFASLLSFNLAADPADAMLLDAARAEFVSHGFRRTSIGDVARRADVSRPTVYRRLGDKEQIVRAVVVREVVRFFTGAAERFAALRTPADRTVETFAAGMAEFRENELGQAVLRFEPEALAAIVAGDRVHVLGPVRDAIALGLAGQDISMAAARRAADLILRITASLLVAPSELLPLDTEEQAREFARTYFVPIIDAATQARPRRA